MSRESKERMNGVGVGEGFVCVDGGNMTTSTVLMLSRGGVLQNNSKLGTSMKCVFSHLRSQRDPFSNRCLIHLVLEQTNRYYMAFFENNSNLC